MKICYVVYREDNVMVFDSQVLEYIKLLKSKVESVELILFRNEKNLFRKKQVEAKILQYANATHSYMSLPVITLLQLKINSYRLSKYIKSKFSRDDKIAVICRGELATYVAQKAFRIMDNAMIIFDNRGLPIEESIMRYGNKLIHCINRKAKKAAIDYAKVNCDMYNFVSENLRNYCISTYGYFYDKRYTIIPTLYQKATWDNNKWERIAHLEKYDSRDFVVSYIGSTAEWQSTNELMNIFSQIYNRIPNSRFFILTNGNIKLEGLPIEIREKIIVKSVPHKDIQYYLYMTDVGVIIRDNNIINKVAAPTKIVEYLLSNINLLYKGDIGILEDIRDKVEQNRLISLDNDTAWLERLVSISKVEDTPTSLFKYFDMDTRQRDTLNMIENYFNEEVNKNG